MNRNKQISLWKCAVGMAAVPVLVWAYPFGPPPRSTGAPGDQTCAQAGCHLGTAVNSSNGKVEFSFDGGNTYTPGERKRVTLTITDTGGGRNVFGFQASSRLASNTQSGQAGSFIPGSAQFVQCEDGRDRPANGCPASVALEFIQHNSASTSNTFTFEWTAPSTNVGDVKFYAAGNAANGDGRNTGDRIYTTSATLTPAAATGQRPTITQNGIVDNFNGTPGVASHSWTLLFGSNLSPNTAIKTWDGDSAFSRNELPTELDGTKVLVNGIAAPLAYILPGQLAFLGPADTTVGDVQIRVTTRGGESEPITVRKAAIQPSWVVVGPQDDRLYLVGVTLQREIAGKQGVGGVNRGFRPGEILQLFGSGFGPTNPAVGTNVASFTAAQVTTPLTLRFGDTPVEILENRGFLISPGLYQYNIRVPDLPNGEYAVNAEIGSVRSSSRVFVSIQR